MRVANWSARLLELGASPAGRCQTLGNPTIIAYYFNRCMGRHRKLSDGKFGRALDDRFEENIEVSLEAGADINARSYFFSSPTPENVTVLPAARDIGLDDSSVQILLRHGAVEGEELEGEWDASSKHAEDFQKISVATR
jgi:hypothetical protein